MNFSDFKRLLGAEPGSRDPEFLRARESSPEFREAAAESDRLERRLRQALEVPVPEGLVDGLKALPDTDAPRSRVRHFALAASLLLAAAAVVVWRLNTAPESIEQYVAQHFHHDGPLVLERGADQIADNVGELLARFDLDMTSEAAGKVGYIMLCPTPAGVGVHFMVHTDSGPVTVIVMPGTAVDDGKRFAFDGMQAELVTLTRGSAAIVAPSRQDIGGMHRFVQQSIHPLALGS